MKRCFVSSILAKIAKEEGVELILEPDYQYVGCFILPNGEKRYFRDTTFDLNGSGAYALAKDKDYAMFFLKKFGYPVVGGETFYRARWARSIGSERNPQAAIQYANRVGFPLIVKPNSRSQGVGVFLVDSEAALVDAIKKVSRYDRVFLVQRLFDGIDYRLLVLDGEILAAYQRIPLSVEGDGVHSVFDLLAMKKNALRKLGHQAKIRMKDPRILQTLQRFGLGFDSVLRQGEHIPLLPNANLSAGGSCVDVTNEIHPAWREMMRSLSRDMNLRYVGVDVLLKRGSLADEPNDFVVLEVNASAGLEHFAMSGALQFERVEQIYRLLIRAIL